MNVLIVFAHPERHSLNGALLDVAVRDLEAQGHKVQVSDLYRLQWKPAVDRSDFPDVGQGDRLKVASASARDFTAGNLTEDVKAEQEKLLWADTVIFQFPLWWFSMPAILKGWIDRVYACGFAYGVGEHNDKRWGDRYGEGKMAGKRAMLVVTTGGWPEHYSARGINGPIDDVLFHITHGMLFYPGFAVLPSFVAYRVDRLNEAQFADVSAQLCSRLRELETASPIAYRNQNGGDYQIPSMELLEGLEKSGETGFSLHVAAP
ncbi:LAMI_0G15962g1_1 [Lachancea mirantina]|uniref:LAMI_0G15962g1_1 n=1 Tax=Lachancea mirantina TaxID=1230905 RepID=A0A1G4KCN9_9SACH|nr:LAMI_0G15962g1_1 [Lachancea mirantina]